LLIYLSENLYYFFFDFFFFPHPKSDIAPQTWKFGLFLSLQLTIAPVPAISVLSNHFLKSIFINIYIHMNLNFKKWLIEAAAPPPAAAAPAAAAPAPTGGGGGGGSGGGSSGGGLFGTGTTFKYTPSNSNKNTWAKTPDQWYKRDMANKFNKGCSGLNCPKSITG
jgi:hypothetical protein